MSEPAERIDDTGDSSEKQPGGIACDQAATLFCDGRDRELSGAERHSLQAHIHGCAACQVASRQLSAVFAQLQQFVNGEAP